MREAASCRRFRRVRRHLPRRGKAPMSLPAGLRTNDHAASPAKRRRHGQRSRQARKPLAPWPKPSVLTQAPAEKGGYSPMTAAIIPGPSGRGFAPPIRGFVGAPLRPSTRIAYPRVAVAAATGARSPPLPTVSIFAMRPAAVPLDSADARTVIGAADTIRAPIWRRAFSGFSPTGIAIIAALILIRAVDTIIDRLVQVKDVDAFIELTHRMFEGLVTTAVMAATMIVIIVAALNLAPGRGPARIAALVAAVFVASGLGIFLRMACGDWFDAPNWEHIRAFVVYVWPRYFVIGSLLTIVAELYRRERASTALAEQAEVDSVALERDLAAARLQALQAQVEPHFLFNTLANVRRLYEEDRVAGRTMLEMLMRYIEVVLPGMRGGEPTLGREAALIEAYLHIQGVRMGSRLAFTVEIPPCLRGAQVPPMM